MEVLLENEMTFTLEPATATATAFAAMMRHADGRYNSVLYWHTLSGADLTARIERADINDLPPEYGKFFE